MSNQEYDWWSPEWPFIQHCERWGLSPGLEGYGSVTTDRVKQVFDEVSGDLEITPALVHRLVKFTRSFINRNDDHVEFFGGVLMGVQVVRFTPQDQDYWFNEVLELDVYDVSNAAKKIDTINPDFKRATDAMNLYSIYLVHRIMNSKLSAKDQQIACEEVMYILQVKFITSIFAHYFKFPADPEIAQAVYESLSRKYMLKQLGSWDALFRQRSKDIIDTSSIHYQTFKLMSDDEGVVYAISDIQGRIREVVKKMYSLLIEMRDNHNRIVTTSSVVVDNEGELALKDKSTGFKAYRTYLHSVVIDRNSFIREELVNIVCDAMHTMPRTLFIECLEYISVNHGARDRLRTGERIDTILDGVVIHAFEYITTNRSKLNGGNDLALLSARLRAIYMASKMNDPNLIKLRDTTEGLVREAASTRNATLHAALRTGVQMYIVLRAFTMRYYG